MNLRNESWANRAFWLWSANAVTARSFKPRLRIVSIMPGIEIGAPDLTETSNGFFGSPSFLPVTSSSRATLPSTSARSRSEYLPLSRYSMHSAQAIVKPGGTGTPRLVISARFAPLPPRTFVMSRVPSADPLPKKKTDCAIDVSSHSRSGASPGRRAVASDSRRRSRRGRIRTVRPAPTRASHPA